VLLAGLDAASPTIRAAAVGCLARSDRLTAQVLATGLEDESPLVRRAAARLAPAVKGRGAKVATAEALGRALDDPDRLVVICALNAIGERQDQSMVERVIEVGTTQTDALIVEEAVACVAELGDDRGIPLILRATEGKPALRRRSVAALGAFEGPEIETALDRLAEDRDWQVRQAVAMLRRGEIA
jgi:HEAT repeat protein